MHLVKVHVEGYRRFFNRTTLITDGKLTAIIGPNESGKSSLLKAISAIPVTQELEIDDLTSYSGRKLITDSPNIVAIFNLDKMSAENLKKFKGRKPSRWLEVRRFGDGRYESELAPIVESSSARAVRKNVSSFLKELKVLFSEKQTENSDSESINKLRDIAESNKVQSIINILDREDGPRLSDATLMLDLMNEISEIGREANVRRLLTPLRENPNSSRPATYNISRYKLYLEKDISLTRDLALELVENIPVFIKFDVNYLSLPDIVHIKDIGKPSAIENLLIMAGSNSNEINSLFEVNKTRLRSRLRQIGDHITQTMHNRWSQTKVGIEFHLDGENIITHAYDYSSRDLGLISSRSEGFRQFVSLVAFLQRHNESGKQVILLIDELETHLHFEAQAELIKLLTSQHVASQVIYTTHSPGALPEDLSAVRAVDTDKELGRSKVNNRLWSNETDGTSAMFLAMGARTFAFSAARRAVVTEGETDFMLYPCIFRQVADAESLGIQFLPGFSHENDPFLFSGQAARVVFLFDGDEPGKSYKRIVDKEMSEGRAFILENQRVLEDYLDGEVYIEAVSREMRRSHGFEYNISKSDLVDVNRPEQLKQWCVKSGIPNLSKRAVADRILDMAGEGALIYRRDKEQFLNALFSSIRLSLESKNI